jgi:methyl-accepting chemotaxis protein
MTLPAFFSRISSKLALMSGIGILMVLTMLMTGWLSNRTVGENALVERQQMGASRDYVDAKASVRGMQIATRDLRLADSADQAAEARTYLEQRHASVVKYLDEALSVMTIQVNRDRIQTIKGLTGGYFSTASELAKVIETKLGAGAALTTMQKR